MSEDVHREEGDADEYPKPVCQEPLHDHRLWNVSSYGIAKPWPPERAFAATSTCAIPPSRSCANCAYLLSPGFGGVAGIFDFPMS
jgi:hypothetical protein